jgi:hypothetical protein
MSSEKVVKLMEVLIKKAMEDTKEEKVENTSEKKKEEVAPIMEMAEAPAKSEPKKVPDKKEVNLMTGDAAPEAKKEASAKDVILKKLAAKLQPAAEATLVTDTDLDINPKDAMLAAIKRVQASGGKMDSDTIAKIKKQHEDTMSKRKDKKEVVEKMAKHIKKAGVYSNLLKKLKERITGTSTSLKNHIYDNRGTYGFSAGLGGGALAGGVAGGVALKDQANKQNAYLEAIGEAIQKRDKLLEDKQKTELGMGAGGAALGATLGGTLGYNLGSPEHQTRNTILGSILGGGAGGLGGLILANRPKG